MPRLKIPEHLIDISDFGRKDRIKAIIDHAKSMNSFIHPNCDYNKVKYFLESAEDEIYKICLLVNSPQFDYFGISYPVLTSFFFPEPKSDEIVCFYTIDDRIHPRYKNIEDKFGLSLKYKRDEKIDKILGE